MTMAELAGRTLSQSERDERDFLVHPPLSTLHETGFSFHIEPKSARSLDPAIYVYFADYSVLELFNPQQRRTGACWNIWVPRFIFD